MKVIDRQHILSQLDQQHYDAIIIGGGITGSGIVRDASLRGLRCLLVEKLDFASGTSSKSGKLIHGGLRYLKQGHLGLVYEACRERYLLSHIIAPHLIRKTKFIKPFYKQSKQPRWLVAMGLFLYSLLAFFRKSGGFKLLSKKSLSKLEPALRQKDAVGALSFYDCVAMDTRLTIETFKSAVESGADILNYCSLETFSFDQGHVNAVVRDRLTNKLHKVRSRVMINATGAWADDVLSKNKIPDLFGVKISCGVHIVIHRKRIPLNHTVTFEAIQDHRNLYMIPWENHVLIGTTDHFYEGDKHDIPIKASTVRYLLDSANAYLPKSNLTFEDVISSFVGIRPLIGAKKDALEESLSRDYVIKVDDRGLISISGGKLTTYRSMAKKVLDKTIQHFFKGQKLKPCQTRSPLPCSVSGPIFSEIIANHQPHFKKFTLSTLIQRYGSQAIHILNIATYSQHKSEPIAEDIPYLWAEIDYMVQHEFVETLSDLMMRRTDLFLFTKDNGLSLSSEIATYLGKLKNWSDHRITSEINLYKKQVESSFKYLRPKTQIDLPQDYDQHTV